MLKLGNRMQELGVSFLSYQSTFVPLGRAQKCFRQTKY